MSAKNITRHIRSRLAWGREYRFSLTRVSAFHQCVFVTTSSGAGYYQRIED